MYKKDERQTPLLHGQIRRDLYFGYFTLQNGSETLPDSVIRRKGGSLFLLISNPLQFLFLLATNHSA
jgi:hypothetical protein